METIVLVDHHCKVLWSNTPGANWNKPVWENWESPSDMQRKVADCLALRQSTAFFINVSARKDVSGRATDVFGLAMFTPVDLADVQAIVRVRWMPKTLLTLTPREREVVQLVAKGETNKAIGEKLGISPKTVEVQITSMVNKTGASGRVELARLADQAWGFGVSDSLEHDLRTAANGGDEQDLMVQFGLSFKAKSTLSLAAKLAALPAPDVPQFEEMQEKWSNARHKPKQDKTK